MDTVCIKCPRGCHLHIEKVKNEIIVTGNNCPRGAEYGKQELIEPKRTITTVFPFKKGTITLRTNGEIPKLLCFKILKEIKSTTAKSKYKVGDIFVKNICKTGIDVIVTSVNQ